MNILNFKVKSQTISCTKRSVIADGQADWVKLIFSFSEDWAPLDKTVLIKQKATEESKKAENHGCCCGHHSHGNSDKTRTFGIHLGTDKNDCFLPQEITAGTVEISMVGYDGEAGRATTTPCTVYVRESGYEGEPDSPIPPTKDLYEQLLDEIDEKTKNIQDGCDGKDGADGFSPTASVEKTESGAKITITDKSGTTTAEVSDGKNGIDGKNGVDGVNGRDGINGTDGFSPKATVTQTESGAKIEITDKEGATTANISNGKDGRDGVDGKNGQDGAAGISPTVSVTKTDTGATISITDVNGTTTADLMNGVIGKDGKDGTNGKDGVSPTAKVTQTETGATIAVTDAKGTTTAVLTNGKSGEKGEKGDEGISITDVQMNRDGILSFSFSDGTFKQMTESVKGYSPSADVEEITGGVKITIADQTGETTATVMDGVSPAISVYTDTSTTYQLKITAPDGTEIITPNLKGKDGGGSTPAPAEKSVFFDSSDYTVYADSVYVYNGCKASQNIDAVESLQEATLAGEKLVDANHAIDINQSEFGWANLALIMSTAAAEISGTEMLLTTANVNGSATEKAYFIPADMIASTTAAGKADEIAKLLTAETIDTKITAIDNSLIHTNGNPLTVAVKLTSVPDGTYYIALSAHSDNSKPIYYEIWIQE